MEKTIRYPWLLFIGIALGPFMICLDFLAIGIAIEPMAKALSIDLPTLQWFLTAFAIGNSSFLVTAGILSDRYGRKAIYLTGLLLFILSSTIISMSSSAWIITGARLLQGASGGLMVTTGIALLTHIYEPKERTPWISGLVGAAGLGMVLGPIVGGVLIHHFSWRMIFLINLPIGMLDLFLAWKFIPAQSSHQLDKKKLDLLGIFLLIATLMLLTIGLNQGHYWGWSDHKTLMAFAGTLLAAVIFVYAELKFPNPVFQFSFFKIKNFFAANIAGFTIYFVFTGWILTYGIYLQRIMNLSPQDAGFYFLPFGVGLFIVSVFMKQLVARFNFKKLIMLGYLLIVIAFFSQSLGSVYPSAALLCICFGLFGLGFSLVNSNAIPAALQFIPIEKSGIAAGKCMMIRWLGGAIGAALTSTIFIVYSTQKVTQLALENAALADSQHLTLLHNIIVGRLPMKTLQESFSGTTLASANQMVDQAYHHGLIASMIMLTLIAVATLITCQLWIKLPNANIVKDKAPEIVPGE